MQSARDGYVGYVPETALTAGITEATHEVAVPGTFLYFDELAYVNHEALAFELAQGADGAEGLNQASDLEDRCLRRVRRHFR